MKTLLSNGLHNHGSFLVQLRDLKPRQEFYRVRAGKLSQYRYQKLGYNRANKAMGWAASFTCGREDDISFDIQLNPDTYVMPAVIWDEMLCNDF